MKDVLTTIKKRMQGCWGISRDQSVFWRGPAWQLRGEGRGDDKTRLWWMASSWLTFLTFDTESRMVVEDCFTPNQQLSYISHPVSRCHIYSVKSQLGYRFRRNTLIASSTIKGEITIEAKREFFVLEIYQMSSHRKNTFLQMCTVLVTGSPDNCEQVIPLIRSRSLPPTYWPIYLTCALLAHVPGTVGVAKGCCWSFCLSLKGKKLAN